MGWQRGERKWRGRWWWRRRPWWPRKFGTGGNFFSLGCELFVGLHLHPAGQREIKWCWNGVPSRARHHGAFQSSTAKGAATAESLVATADIRRDFVSEVWNLDIPTGSTRYYAGIMQLTAYVIMSGQLRVY